MEVEVIPNKVRPETSSPEPQDAYKDLEPEETPPEFREQGQTTNETMAWIKQNKWKVGGAAVSMIFLLGFVSVQIFGNNEPKEVVKVTDFKGCVENGGSILDDVDPRECYLKQVRFVEEVEREPEEENTAESAKEEEPKEEVTETVYSNETFPDFSLTYSSDWKKTEDNTETGTTLILQKNGITLTYNIGLIEIFGDQGGSCTNNNLLFLGIDGSDWYRVRLNNGERIYTQNLVLKNEGNSANNPEGMDFGDVSKIGVEWAELMPLPEGVYKACLVGSTNSAGVTDSSLDADMETTTGKKFGLVSIKISGLDESNKDTLKEADQIVASTDL